MNYLKEIEDAGLLKYVDFGESKYILGGAKFGCDNLHKRIRKPVDRSNWSWSSKLK